MAYVGKDLKDHQVPSPLLGTGCQPQDQIAQASSNLALTVFSNGASTTSPGNLCQCLITLWEKNFPLTSHLNLPFYFKDIPPCPITIRPCKKSLPLLLKYWNAAVRFSWNLSSPCWTSPALSNGNFFTVHKQAWYNIYGNIYHKYNDIWYLSAHLSSYFIYWTATSWSNGFVKEIERMHKAKTLTDSVT